MGSHYDEYIIMYNTFSASINSSVFNISAENCISFPGPGITFPMAESPIFEYIGAQGYERKHQSHKIDTDFNDFKEKHGRKYENDKDEAQRKFHFRQNHRYLK